MGDADAGPKVGELPSIDLVSIVNGEGFIPPSRDLDGKERGPKERAVGFLMMVKSFIKSVGPHTFSYPLQFPTPWQLPDMQFPISTRTEGRVIVPWNQTDAPVPHQFGI